MATNKLRVNFFSVKEGAIKLKDESNNLNANINNDGNLSNAVSPLIDVGLVPTYFSKYSDYVSKTITYMENLSSGVLKYHDQLVNIEGYLTEEQLKELENKNKNKNGYNPNGVHGPGGVDVETGSGDEQVNLNEIRIPENIVLETGYGKLSIYADPAEVNKIIEKIISKYNITLAQLFSGDYNPAITDITTSSPNLSVYITTITQLDKIELQNYIKELSDAETTPPLFSNLALFITFLAKNLNKSYNALVSDLQYADKLKDSIIEHKNSLVTLNDIALKDSQTIQTELNKIIYENSNKTDNVTNEMLKQYLELVAEENGISLSDLLNKTEYQNLAKQSLQNFVNTILYGEYNEIPLLELTEIVQPILDETGATIEDVINGDNNDALTNIIENSNSQTSTGIINNMDDNALQDYIKEVVDGKYPTVIDKPIIKEIIKTIVVNKDKITNNDPIPPIDLNKPLPEDVNKEIIDEKPVIVDDDVKEILKNQKYASQVKSAVKNNGSLGWLVLLPIAGLGLIPLYGMYKKKKDNNQDDFEQYYEKEPVTKKIIVDDAFSNFAKSNSTSEEKLLDGSNFEALTMYLSTIDNINYILNILSLMKDEVLQKYLFELYNLKFEHIWSKNTTNLRLIFNYLNKTAIMHSLELEKLLNNSNYVVWIKSTIIDLSKAYNKYEEDIKYNGGFVTYVNNILNKSIQITEENYEILKTYIEENSKNKGLSIKEYLEKLTDNDNRMKIFSIIQFGDGYDKYAFGFLSIVKMIINQNTESQNPQDVLFGIMDNSGYLSLLFNSTELQISQAIDKILEKINVKKEDLFNGKKEDILDILIQKAPNVMVILSILSNFDQISLQKYLNKVQLLEKNKFVLFIFKFLEYLAKSENTTLSVLLVDAQYAELIKSSLLNLKESVIKLYALSKKDDKILNEEINNIFFMEDPAIFGIDKITISLLKTYFANSAEKMGVGLNYLLDIKNVNLLKKFINELVQNIIYFSINKDIKDSNEKKNILTETISLQEAKNSKNGIIVKIKKSIENEINDSLKNKFKKYIEIFGRDTNMTFNEYIDSNEFYNFININFENSNIMELVYKYISHELDYSFDIEEKFNYYSKNNNIEIDEFKSVASSKAIVESIVKEDNILYSLESLINIKNDSYEHVVRELNLVKENTNLNNLFIYIEEHLKRPRQTPIEEYINEKSNLKNIWMLILKVLIIILIILLISSKEEVK